MKNKEEVIYQKGIYRAICKNEDIFLVYRIEKIWNTCFGTLYITAEEFHVNINKKKVTDRKIKNIINCLNNI